MLWFETPSSHVVKKVIYFYFIKKIPIYIIDINNIFFFWKGLINNNCFKTKSDWENFITVAHSHSQYQDYDIISNHFFTFPRDEALSFHSLLFFHFLSLFLSHREQNRAEQTQPEANVTSWSSGIRLQALPFQIR